MKPHVSSNAVFKNNATVLVADAKPLSLLATAGVLHHAGMRCLCARTFEAVYKACEIDVPPARSAVDSGVRSPADGNASENDVARATDALIDLVEQASRGDRLRADQGGSGLPATSHTANSSHSSSADRSAAESGKVDLIVWDVGDEAPEVLDAVARIRQTYPDMPVILLAEVQWAGLEKKAEALAASTRCLFKPIDPSALVSVAEPLLWMPALQSVHRNRGSRPSRPGWVTL